MKAIVVILAVLVGVLWLVVADLSVKVREQRAMIEKLSKSPEKGEIHRLRTPAYAEGNR